MTENGTRGHVLVLAGALAAGERHTPDEAAAMQAGVVLVTQLLCDVHRIADALEHIAKKCETGAIT